jgi:LuxR family maltose regulon positive regulatory protein
MYGGEVGQNITETREIAVTGATPCIDSEKARTQHSAASLLERRMPSIPAGQAAGLRSARFSPPRAPSIAVERAHLVARIDESDPQVTLICAPAGFGKSTLMQQLRKRVLTRGFTTVWLRLEQGDNDLACFLRSLATATSLALGKPLQDDPLDRKEISAVPAHGLAADLIDRLSLSDAAVVLFLDDLELVSDEEVWSYLQRLLADLDARHRIVLGSRTKPSLALGRIRADGRLLELAQAELCFTPEESRAYLERQSISAPVLRALQQHTEGWPAALQLATVAINGKTGRGADALRAFSGSSASVAEYLAQEILDSCPSSQRDFLLRSSVLGEFCAELCDATLERSDSEEMIAQIVRANLLLSPIDAEQRWYRFHPLFADFLRASLQREAKEQFRTLHQRAAAWTADRGLMNEAVAHALAAQDEGLAADLLAVSAMDNVRSGRVEDTAGAISSLPEAEIRSRPPLLRAAAFAAIFAHRYDTARRYMEIVERADGDDDEVIAMRLMLLGWSDRIPELLEQVEALGDKPSRFAPFTAGLTANARAFCDIALCRYVDAQAHLRQARQACEPINALYVLSYAASFAAAIELNVGDVAAARVILDGAMNRAIAAGQRYGSSGAVVATYLTELLYETNELDACQAFVDDYLPIVTETGLPDHLIVLHRIAARLHFLRGRRDAGYAALVRLHEIGARRGLPRLSAVSWLERSHAALRSGDVEGARRALATGSDGTLWESFGAFNPQASEIDDVMMAELRFQLVAGEANRALPQIQAALQRVEAAGRRRRALRLRFLESQALEAAGRRREAGAVFDAAVRRAAESGMKRALCDEVWVVNTLVGRSAVTGDAVGLLRELGAPPAAPSVARPDASGEHASASFRLTTREAQILRLVWKGGSNKAIARDLFLTENTIETHLRRIYEKLGTRKRTQAAALAREAGAI